jgi:hypothetical protein
VSSHRLRQVPVGTPHHGRAATCNRWPWSTDT